MKIDFHAHFDSTDPVQVRAFVEDCSKRGIRTAISGGTMGDSVYANDDQILAFCQEYPDWLIPLSKIDLWDSSYDLSHLRQLKDRGIRGLKIIYPYYAYDHDLYMPVYEECEKLELPILFHTGDYRPCKRDAIVRRPMISNMHPLTLDRIARSFPKLHIVMAHLGTTYFRTIAAELLKNHPNLFADLGGCGTWMALSPQELGDLLCHHLWKRDPDASYFNKLVFGSDCYITRPDVQENAEKYYLEDLKMNAVPQEIQDNVMGNTVAKWLGLMD